MKKISKYRERAEECRAMARPTLRALTAELNSGRLSNTLRVSRSQERKEKRPSIQNPELIDIVCACSLAVMVWLGGCYLLFIWAGY